MIRIIGIGSPLGEDAVGLEAARQLALDPPAGTEVVAADRPGAGLIDLFDGAEAVILIDAVCSGSPCGTVHDLDLRDLADAPLRPVSSHDLGVAEAVRLAAALGRLPARSRLLGIEVRPDRSPDPSQVSTAVKAALDRVVKRAREWAADRP